MDGLGLKGLRLVDIYEPDPLAAKKADRKRRFVVEATMTPDHCPSCGSVSLYRHGIRTQNYADVPCQGEPAVLQVKRRRWRCNDCPTTFPDPLPDMDDSRHATRRLVEYVGKRSLKFTFESVARDVGISGPAARDMFQDLVDSFQRKYRFLTPGVLGIDELYLLNEYRCILINIERRTVYDILPTRKVDFLRKYFPGLENRQNVRYVASDFYKPYPMIARDYFPDAKLVIDRFHVQHMGNTSLEAARKHHRRSLSKSEPIGLKNDRSYLLKHAFKLNEKQRAKLQKLMNEHAILGWAWALKETFHEIWNAEDRDDANRRMDVWLQCMLPELEPFFKEPISVFTTRRDEILNFFDSGVTNAYTESMNGITKTANHMGRGYSFEAIRARILYNEDAIIRGSAVLREPAPGSEEDAGMQNFMMLSQPPPSNTRYTTCRVYYGAHIPTLVQLAETGKL